MKFPAEFLLGTTRESFHIAGYKVGFVERTTAPSGDFADVLVTCLHHVFFVGGEIADFQHVFSFFNRPGCPSYPYLLDTGGGAPQGTALCCLT